METRNDIVNELRGISPVLAGIPKTNVFTVPDGYFTFLADTILAQTSETEMPGIQAGMEVPDGYFDSLADKILGRIKQEEASEISPLLKDLRSKPVFELPDGYFDALPAAILARVNAEEAEELSPLMKQLRSKNVFEVPQGYFETLGEEIASKTMNQDALTEIAGLSPMLAGLQSKQVFSVPDGYLDGLSESVMQGLQPKQQAKVVVMSSRRSIFRYAVAAAFTGLVVFGGYKVINQGGGTIDPPATAQLTKVQEEGLKILKQSQQDSTVIEAEYAKVSDDDIIKYLESNNVDVDAATVASTIDEKELPSQEDYMMDDKTLDKFLNQITDEDGTKN